MEYTTKNPTIYFNFLENWLIALTTRPAQALLTTPTLELYKAGPTTPDAFAAYTDFTPCDFTGYAPLAGAPAGPVNDPSGKGEAFYLDKVFIAGSPFISGAQNALGYLLSDGAGALYMWEAFPVPVPFTASGDFLDLNAMLSIMYYPQVS